MRPLQVTVDTQALQQNFFHVKKLAPASKVMAVLKANAYGHGLIESAMALKEADGFAVLNLADAIDLREHGFEQKILLLEGFFAADEVNICANMNIEAVIHNHEQIQMIDQSRIKKLLDIHLKFNTGMNRLGFVYDKSSPLIDELLSHNKINNVTLMTHFATADEAAGIDQQMQHFLSICKGRNQLRSVANSAAIIRYPESHMEWVRPGIMLYGASPFSDQHVDKLQLKPVMTMSSEIIAVQHLKAGQSVGYGSMFQAKKNTRVGIVAAGYADGYPRHAPTGTPVIVDGARTKTLGRVSMDMLYVDITAMPNAGRGSNVELWGKKISVDEVAAHAGTVGYELLCAVSASIRVPLGYQHGEK